MATRTDELLDEIAAYADRLADSDRLADKGSMATAEALAELYEKREWVDEWLEQKPIHERKAYVGGRPPEPDSRNRFSQWLVWKEEQRQRRPLVSRRTYQLLNAYEVRGYLHLVQITSERAVRPFDWFRKNGYTACHQTFSGSSTGDAHRVGPHPQRCLTAEELTGLGLWVETNQYGTDVWHGSPNKAGIQKRRPSLSNTT